MPGTAAPDLHYIVTMERRDVSMTPMLTVNLCASSRATMNPSIADVLAVG